MRKTTLAYAKEACAVYHIHMKVYAVYITHLQRYHEIATQCVSSDIFITCGYKDGDIC